MHMSGPTKIDNSNMLDPCGVLCCVTLLMALAPGVTGQSDRVNLRGVGSAFPYEVYKEWIAGYKSHRVRFQHLNMTYNAVGSLTGKNWIEYPGNYSHGIEFAGVTGQHAELHPTYDAAFPSLRMIPAMAGAVVIGFNLPGITTLNMSRELLVGIYTGTHMYWDDPAFLTINPEVQLPHRRIVPIARDDTCGETEIFTRALSAFSADWKARFGVFDVGRDENKQPIHWDPSVVQTYGTTHHGMAGLILSVQYSVGYISVADAHTAMIHYAGVTNKYGRIVYPDVYHIEAAMGSTTFDDSFHADLVDADGLEAYPISTYTYIILDLTGMTDCESTVELYRFIEWTMHDEVAREDCTSLDFVPLSSITIQEVEDRVLSQMTCRGQQVLAMVADRIRREELSLQTWRTPVYVSIGVIICIFIAIGAYFVYIQIKINRALWKDEWKIPYDNINIENGNTPLSRSLISVSSKRNQISLPNIKRINASRYDFSNSKSTLGSLEQWAFSSIKIGHHNKTLMILRETKLSVLSKLSTKTRRHFLWMRDEMQNVNVAQFYGLTNCESSWWFLSEHCSKGFVRDILQNENYNLDLNLKYSMACDVASGMKYLHSRGIVHGNLSTTSCYVDNRWTVKVADWTYTSLAHCLKDGGLWQKPLLVEQSLVNDENIQARQRLWFAPEILRGILIFPDKTCDVYSFAMLLVEIFSREDPFVEELEEQTPNAVLNNVKLKGVRPNLNASFPEKLQILIIACWDWMPNIRPSFHNILSRLNKIKPSKKGVLDCMMDALDDYTRTLEEKVTIRTEELNVKMQEFENLLHKMLPPEIAMKLAKGEPVEPESFESVTIFFSDIVGFTAMSSESRPIEVVTFLNDLYTTFDMVLDQHQVYKVETIGDAYMVISGLPARNGIAHAGHIATMALELAIAVGGFQLRHRPEMKLQMRAGMHSGPVCAGVVGTKMPRYCLFGDTVNMASRMESTSVALKIQVSEVTHHLLVQLGGYQLKLRGEVDIKGKGKVKTYWLHGQYGLQGVPPVFRRDVD